MTMTRLRSNDGRLNLQRGGVAIWFALLLPVLLGFAALAVDLTRLHLVKVELQNAADAAAMGGARSLTDAGGDPFNWTAATAKALELARQNVANGAQIQDATIETGYWNLQSRSWSGTFVTGYLPAVRTTIAISDTQNNGPLNLLFAPILGIADSNVEASATAVIAPPAGGTGLFPLVISRCIFDEYWDSETNMPKLDPETNMVSIFSVYLNDPDKACHNGQWTSFDLNKNDRKTIQTLINEGNSNSLGIGDSTWIEPGVKAALYDDVQAWLNDNTKSHTVALFVVDNPGSTHSQQSIVAIAGFHIESVVKHGNKGTINGRFIEPKIFPGLDPGDGSGGLYGAYTPPILVK